MNLGNLKEIESVMTKIMNAQLPVGLAFRLSIIVDDINNHLEKLETFRIKLVKKYGIVDDKGGITVPENKTADFNTEYFDLLDSVVDITPIKIPFGILEDIGFKVSIREIKALHKAGFLGEPE